MNTIIFALWMDEQGDKNTGQQQNSTPESPPLSFPAETNLPWNHETTLFSSFIGNSSDQQAHDHNSNYQDIFNTLSNIELLSPAPPVPPPPPPPLPPTMMLTDKIRSVGGAFEKGEASGTKRSSNVVQVHVQVPYAQSEVITQEVEREDQQQRPRTRRRRSAQLHNLSERTRRGQITEKIRALQELVPNCNKADKASVLADAIEYIKHLQQQVQMKSTCPNMLVPYYSPVYPMRPMMGFGYGMGMYGSPYATGFPLSPSPQGLNSFGEEGLLQPPSQLLFPSVHTMETSPTTTTTSNTPKTATPSTSITSLSSSFSQGESSSAQSLPRIDTDLYQAQILNQGFTSVQASQIVRGPSSFRTSSSAEDSLHMDEEALKFHHDTKEKR